jgi:sec-independent protein translocase protein TatA
MNLGPGEITVIALVAILLLGWKKLPDMARSLGRSMRVFKSEVTEMKQDGKAASEPVAGQVVPPPTPPQVAPPVAPQGVPTAADAEERAWRPDGSA